MTSSVSPEIERLLTSEPLMAHLATSVDDRPHVAPVWYHYDDGVVEVLTTGQKLQNIRQNPKVALSIQKDESGQAQWRVTLLGTATVVDDEEATHEAVSRINPKYGVDLDAWSDNVLVRIDVGSVTANTY